MLRQKILSTALVLTLFAVLGSGLVAVSFKITRQQIAANERAALLRNLNEIIPEEQYDNSIFNDIYWAQDKKLLGTAQAIPVYRARKGQQPVAAVFTPVAPDGYNGSIRLLVGVYYQGTLAGVRVISHQETPGLGDKIERQRSDWILTFNGRSLTDPPISQWKVKRDGGLFDQFTGATITPRAVVNAVKNTLLFFQQYRQQLFAENTPKTPQD